MSFFNTILSDLREKRLWPIALLLLGALVAVPVLLSSSAKPASVPHPAATPPPSAATALPAVSVSSQPGNSRLSGRGRDPFTQMLTGATATASAATATSSIGANSTPTTGSTSPTVGATSSGTAGADTSAGATNSVSAPSGSNGSSGSTAGGAQPSPSTGTSSTPALPHAPSKPAPAGLTATQSYDVALAITNSSGGFDTRDPLTRLSLVPSTQNPLLVELGVLRGGRRALFAVQPGAALSGPGTCVPSKLDCEVLSLAPGQTEQLSKRTPAGLTPVALFAVTAITAQRHPSAAAANRARRTASAAGARLLAGSPSPVVSLFQYNPGLGAVVDLRNLTVGGS